MIKNCFAVLARHRRICALLLAVFCTLLTPQVLCATEPYVFSNGLMSVFFLLGYAFLFWRSLHPWMRRDICLAALLGVLFAAFLVLGRQMTLFHHVLWSNALTWLAILFLGLAAGTIVLQLFAVLDKCTQNRTEQNRTEQNRPEQTRTEQNRTEQNRTEQNRTEQNRTAFVLLGKFTALRCRPVLVWLLILLAWIPVLLAIYPGVFSVDSALQLNQYNSGSITAHHPPLHTFIIGFLYHLGKDLTGTENGGVCAIMIFSMLLFAGSFSNFLFHLEKWGVSRHVRIFAGCYFAFFPFVPLFVLQSNKDAPFCAFLLFFVVFSIDLLRNKKRFFRSPFLIGRFVLVALLMALFRNNAVLALFPFAVFVCFSIKRVRLRLPAALCFGSIFALYLCVTGVLFPALNISKGRSAEALSVPIQQIGRAWRDGTISDAQKQELSRFWITPDALDAYAPQISDPLKYSSCFDDAAFNQNKGAFFSLWAQIGLANKQVYAEAFLELTCRAWTPGAILTGTGMGFNSSSIKIQEQDNALSRFYLMIGNVNNATKNKIPLFAALFNLGMHFWLFLFSLVLAIRRKNVLFLGFAIFLLSLTATYLAGPVTNIRYYFYLFMTMPLMLAFILNPDAFERKHQTQ